MSEAVGKTDKLTQREALIAQLEICTKGKCSKECEFRNLDDCYFLMMEMALRRIKKSDPVKIMPALFDLRDEWIAKLPRGEWYKNEKAQGIETGIEMAIKKLEEVLYGEA